MKQAWALTKSRDVSVQNQSALNGVGGMTFRYSLIVFSLSNVLTLASCTTDRENSELADWHQQAITTQFGVSGLMAYYESAPSLIRRGALDPAVCGKEQVDERFGPISKKISWLKDSAAHIGYIGKGTEKSLDDAGQIIERMRNKIPRHRETVLEMVNIPVEDQCPSAADIAGLRADFEDLFLNILVATTPR